jgi:hypothetical protein
MIAPAADVGPRWVRTQFDARAQAKLSFVLDDTRYVAVIRVDAPAKITPAR